MKRFLLTPKNDYVFKSLFCRDPEILADLINCVLQPPEQKRIVEVKIKNPGILPEELNKKFIVLDVRAEDRDKNQYDIEMQVRRYDNYPKRTLYYLSRMYADQLKTGEDYMALRPVIGIHFLDYEHFSGHPAFHYRFSFKDIRYPELTFTDDFSFHLLELPGIEKQMQSWKEKPLAEWMHFFNHAHQEGEKNMREQYTNPKIRKAFDVLQTLSMDENERRLAEVRERALKDEVSFLAAEWRKGMEKGMEKGIKKGRREGQKQIALQLIRMKALDIEKIAEASQLGIDEIRKLEKEYLDSKGLPES